MHARYAYLIERTDDETEPDRRTLSRGSRTPQPGWDERALADELVSENRVAHSYYTGPLRCSLWAHEAGEPIPATAPDDATRFEY